MKVLVDVKKCQLHGQCIISAPKVFSFDAEGNIVWLPEVDEAGRAEVEEAADVCPVQAITIED